MGIKNSDLVANLVALPQVANNPSELGGVVRIAQGNVALAAGDSDDNDIVMLAPIPTNATILSVRVGSDSLGGSCTFNVGFYPTTATSDADAIDEDALATTIADGAGVTEVRYDVLNLNTTGQQVWELAGQSSDPSDVYYVAATFNAAGGSAGDMAFIIEYIVN
jgi:hypothetical protein